MMLPTVVLDPVVLWLLDGSESPSARAEEFLKQAVKWIKPDTRHSARLVISERALTRLQQAGMFPAEPHFTKVIEATGLSHVVSPKQLARDISRFLANIHIFEDEAAVKDGLFESFSATPCLFDSINDDAMKTMSADNACLVAANIKQGNSFIYGYSRDVSGETSIVVNCDVSGLHPQELEPVVGSPISVKMNVIRKPDEYLNCFDAELLWKNASTEIHIKMAIELEAQEIAKEQRRPIMKTLRIGSEFLSTLNANDAAGDGIFASVVRKKCAQVLAEAENLEINDFHTDTTRTEVRIRKRDDARAKRVHVTKSDRALRLMFWEKQDVIELATLGNKNEEYIHEGEVLEADQEVTVDAIN
ncbi:hypothetical protein [Microvirga sp. VF16]|uniref:hypothetical protein n=1 Tax=Microvirga sp. VF16 TaxID=2807101 RepID=UPI00193D4552|nr:hypothetical protein [Microvirga sp. VF16]QRM27882.1 hypothetical protein JO965_16665 [Microvirga sp. VF16]